jgi:hypothetical protein
MPKGDYSKVFLSASVSNKKNMQAFMTSQLALQKLVKSVEYIQLTLF